MINYLATRAGLDTVRPFIERWFTQLSDLFTLIAYEDLPDMTGVARATTIFSDLERLSLPQLQLASAVRRTILEQAPDTVVLNDPGRSLRRFELLQQLHRLGRNPFSAYRVREPFAPTSYPVFIRYDSRHSGPITGLLHSRAELERALLTQVVRRRNLSDLLVVEYFDTADDQGMYTKYGSFVVGDRVILKHVKVSDDWVTKGPNRLGEAARKQELRLLDENPHKEAIAEIASIAGITYGRIDYAVVGDSFVTWEFNTNPIIVHWPEDEPPDERPKLDFILPVLAEAFQAVSGAAEAEELSLASVPESVGDMARSARSIGRPPGSKGRRIRSILSPAAPVAEAVAYPFRESILERAGVGLRPESQQS